MSSNDRDVMISVRGLGKAYTIAAAGPRATTLAEAAVSRLRRPLQRPARETFWALEDVSFDVRRGDVVGVIGRNGAGKSTLFKVLSRITEPTTGQVDLYGRVGSLLEVGTGFSGELSGRENIYLNGSILGMRRAEIAMRFDEIVDFAGVEKFLDTPVKRYSSGMYVRLAFAVAANLESDILIIDEVLAVGDSAFQEKCLGKMKSVARSGRTVLFVSHNMAAVVSLCNQAILLKGGQLQMAGDTIEVAARYAEAMRMGPALTAITAASPNDPLRMLSAWTVNAAGDACNVFEWGEPISVCVRVVNDTGLTFTFGIRVNDGLGREILHVTSQDEVDRLTSPAVTSDLQITLLNPCLNDGRYSVSLFLCDRQFHMLSGARDCLPFEIHTISQGQIAADSVMRLRSRWTLDPSGDTTPASAPPTLAGL